MVNIVCERPLTQSSVTKEIKSLKIDLIIYFYWGGVYLNLFTSLKIQFHKYVATGKNKKKFTRWLQAGLVCKNSLFFNESWKWEDQMFCKMLPFELLYLLDFFVKPLAKITDTCCKGRVVEFKKNEWKQENLVLWIFLILKKKIVSASKYVQKF